MFSTLILKVIESTFVEIVAVIVVEIANLPAIEPTVVVIVTLTLSAIGLLN